jgi:cephalosporin hydroxylase
MKLTIDSVLRTLSYHDGDGSQTFELYSVDAYNLVAQQYMKIGWSQKHDYRYSWFGMPIIQLPNDMVRMQEAIYHVRPDVIVETGIAHGGSLIFYASLCKAMDQGRVIGIDIEIRPHNRAALESHELFPLITLVEGSSVDSEVVEHVRSMLDPDETVLVILDSCHTLSHVLAELDAYADIVTPGSFIVATDGAMRDLYDVPRGQRDWEWDNPAAAATQFLNSREDFDLVAPPRPFDEGEPVNDLTHWPDAWLLRRT